MFHFTYKVSTESGKYYVGRHSTKNIDDGYLGSGKWPKSIKDKSSLHREILNFYQTFEELVQAEEKLLIENINNPMNMNFNNKPSGFGSGNFNVCHDPEVKKKREDIRWSEDKKLAKSKSMSENNPSMKIEVKQKRRDKALEQLSDGSHNFLNPITIENKTNATKVRLKVDNPMFVEKNKILVSNREKENWKLGIHNWQNYNVVSRRKENVKKFLVENNPMRNKEVIEKLFFARECPHCGKQGKGPNMTRYHFDNCKTFGKSKS